MKRRKIFALDTGEDGLVRPDQLGAMSTSLLYTMISNIDGVKHVRIDEGTNPAGEREAQVTIEGYFRNFDVEKYLNDVGFSPIYREVQKQDREEVGA